MSHNIENFVYSGEEPWHNLGKRILPDLTPAQVLKAADLDWEVKKVPALIDINGEQISINRNALVRSSDNRVLTVVTDDWEPIQNKDAFEFFHDFVKAGDMEMHTAGSLRQGEIVFALAKVKESFEVFGGDRVDAYLLFTNFHQFGVSTDVRFTPTRVVCNNTLDLALGGASSQWYKTSHRKKFDPELAKQTLGVVTNKMGTYKEAAEFLGSKRYNADSLIEYFNKTFPITSSKDEKKQSKNAKLAMEVIERQPGSNFAEGSWWQSYNACTYMIDHMLGRSQDNRVVSSWYGSGKQLKVDALERAIDFANAS